jgi:hypothetical protein
MKIRKLFITITLCFALVSVTSAQDTSVAQTQDIFAKGDIVVNAGIGFINMLNTGNGWKTTVSPVMLSGEYGIIDKLINGRASIGGGLNLGYSAQKFEYTVAGTNTSYKYSNLSLGTRGSFHYQFIDKLDTYVGLMLGYNIVSGNKNYSTSDFLWCSYVGARYYFTKNFAVMSEIGDNIALITIGVAWKF